MPDNRDNLTAAAAIAEAEVILRLARGGRTAPGRPDQRALVDHQAAMLIVHWSREARRQAALASWWRVAALIAAGLLLFSVGTNLAR